MFSFISNLLKFGKFVVRKMSTDSFKGVPFDDIYRGNDAWHLNHLPPIVNKRDHIVLYQLPIEQNSTQPPKPYPGDHKWDSYHVRLPCALQNEYRTENSSGRAISTPRWELIQMALSRDIRCSKELEQAILTYNTKYASNWRFRSLHTLFEEELDEADVEAFFGKTLPGIIRLAIQLPETVKSAIPLLKRGQNKSISLSQQQIACLLANAFLCTFPRRNDHKSGSEYASYPTINFNSLFQTDGEQNLEKIKCVCNYFRRVCNDMPTGVVTFTRRSMPKSDLPSWNSCHATFDSISLHVTEDGTIEDDGEGLLQVDFANKYLGGGVLNYGCVQEEIRFMICPELLITRLFTEQLDENECLTIMGCERFNDYRGYASTFQWTNDYTDETPRDPSHRRKCTIVAIDAVPFRSKSHQYKTEMLQRELNKAYIGFKHDLNTPAPGVATGNWGCGAFNGSKHLKSIIQLMACCANNRPLVYFTFGDAELRDELYKIYGYLVENKMSIGQVWRYLKGYAEYESKMHLYEFIVSSHESYRERKLHTNGQSSTQANRSVEPTEKPKRVRSSPEPMQPPSSVDTADYAIENSSDDEYGVEEVMDALKKSDNQYQNKSVKQKVYQSPSATTANKSSSTTSGSRTIQRFFSPSTSTAENQEKRPRSSLLESLDDDFNRKSPAKMQRHSVSTPKYGLDLDSPRANSSMVGDHNSEDQKESINAESTTFDLNEEDIRILANMSENMTDDEDPAVKDEPVEKGNMNPDKSSSNPSTSGCFEESQDGDDVTPESDHDKSAMSEGSLFEDAECDPEPEKTIESPKVKAKKGTSSSKKGLDPSRKMMESFVIRKPRSIHSTATSQSSPSSWSTSSRSNEDDQENSDLNTEADQLEALHMASDK